MARYYLLSYEDKIIAEELAATGYICIKLVFLEIMHAVQDANFYSTHMYKYLTKLFYDICRRYPTQNSTIYLLLSLTIEGL